MRESFGVNHLVTHTPKSLLPHSDKSRPGILYISNPIPTARLHFKLTQRWTVRRKREYSSVLSELLLKQGVPSFLSSRVEYSFT